MQNSKLSIQTHGINPTLQHMTNENGNTCFQHLGKKPWNHDEK